MIDLYQQSLNELFAKRKLWQDDLIALEKSDDALKQSIIDHSDVRIYMQQTAKLVQTKLADQLAALVTKALDIVFTENYSFKIRFVDDRRNATECDLILCEDSEEYDDLFDSCGYGVLDVVSFALRIAYLLIGNHKRILFFDECFRHLSDDDALFAAEMVNQLSKELHIQMLIFSDKKTLRPAADRLFNVVRRNKISTVTEVKNTT